MLGAEVAHAHFGVVELARIERLTVLRNAQVPGDGKKYQRTVDGVLRPAVLAGRELPADITSFSCPR